MQLMWKPDGTTVVAGMVSTNKAELFVDGKSQGRRSVTPGEEFTWDVSGGPTPSPFPTAHCNFSANFTGVQCHGLERKNAKTATACAEECCSDNSCGLWQFSENKGCWTGSTCASPKEGTEWSGAGKDGMHAKAVNNATIVAIDRGGVGASHSLLAPGPAARITLTIDV